MTGRPKKHGDSFPTIHPLYGPSMNRFFLLCFGTFFLFAASAMAQTTVTVIGPVTPGDCAVFNSTTVIKDSGGTGCAGGGAGVPGGTNGQIQFNNSGNFGGTSSPTISGQFISNSASAGSAAAFLASSVGFSAYAWQLTGQPADQKVWDILAQGSILQFRAVNDANSAATAWMTVARGAGATVSSVTFSAPQLTVPYTAGLFSNGSPAANITRLDRLLVSTASVNSGDSPDTTKDWLETLIPNTTSIAQSASITPLSGIGILGASRASDVSTNDGQGVSAFNNCNTTTSSCWGFYGEAWNNNGSNNAAFTTTMELDIVNKNATPVTIDPYSINPGGETAGIWLASGGSRSGAQTASAAMVVLNNGANFNAGIIFSSNSIAGGGPAILMPSNYQVVWYISHGVTGGSIASSSGGGLSFQVGAALAASVFFDANAHIDTTSGLNPSLSSCGSSPTFAGNDWAGHITTGTGATACTVTFSHSYVSQPLCIFYAQGGTTVVQETSVGAAAITFTAAASASYIYHCFAAPGG